MIRKMRLAFFCWRGKANRQHPNFPQAVSPHPIAYELFMC
jgi:hypothetical protein